MKKIVLAIVALLAMNITVAQSLEELKAEKASKKDSIAAIQGRVDAIQGKINAIPGWKKGAFGTIGASLSGFNNWYSKGTPNSSAGNIGITTNAFANLNQPKYFWRNSLNINLGWVKIDDKDIDTDDDSFRSATDVFNITSLYGRKLSDKFAISTLGEYRTTIIDNFNDPGYLDIGVGATWTPITDLVVVIHPLNYNFVFSSGDTVFESSLGAKIVADYTKKLGDVNFKTNLSLFQSYKSADYSNWTWTNSFGYTLWKGIGLGFEFGLRNNKQEALNYALGNLDVGDPIPTFASIDNDLQTYWLFGLNYSF
ncbi:DUF3078 domain-containing protein [Arenibacter sp. M-2]|uniref:DUF3078 domain-containing protein n=1 Tax=unclassified Arenibacter TaxID=2615047 RepID=UPI000D75B8A4|nr:MULTISPECIES: DUF3078 domain-containing protein [unclassified Arenibacter]MDL5510176.1 DUF3078 domain-containing protein [Arenibacter sp. M-2]PXX27740.1 hypothetical protein C7972_10690 [Arenibacter sp. ARW7G5Y1]|tara:strand:- start:39517 stop:40449 length:933 start_codon:yes stop_codon:yes gene_type:complete